MSRIITGFAVAPHHGNVSVKINTLDGGTNGAQPTTGSAETAPGDTTFSAVGLPTAGTWAYDNTHTHGSGEALHLNLGATSASAFVELPLGASVGTAWIRFYLYYTAAPSSDWILASFRGAGVARLRVTMGTGGRLKMQDNTGASQGTAGGVLIPTNTWVRIEAKCIGDPTNGNGEIKIFGASATSNNDPESSTPDEVIGNAATNFNTGGTVDSVRFGNNIAGTAREGWFDDLAIGAGGYIGADPPPPSGPSSLTLFGINNQGNGNYVDNLEAGPYTAGSSAGIGMRLGAVREYTGDSTKATSPTAGGGWDKLNASWVRHSTASSDPDHLTFHLNGHTVIWSINPPWGDAASGAKGLWSDGVSSYARIARGDYDGSSASTNYTDGLYGLARRLYNPSTTMTNSSGMAFGVDMSTFTYTANPGQTGRAYGGKVPNVVYFGWHHEPENDSSQSQNYGTAAEFQDALHHIISIFEAVRAGGTKRVKMGVIFVGSSFDLSGSSKVDTWLSKYKAGTYPKTELDWIGCDPYFPTAGQPYPDPASTTAQFGAVDPNDSTNKAKQYSSVPHIWNKVDTVAQWGDTNLYSGIPVVVAEVACFEYTSYTGSSSSTIGTPTYPVNNYKDNFIKDIPNYCAGNISTSYLFNNATSSTGGPRIEAVCWFEGPATNPPVGTGSTQRILRSATDPNGNAVVGVDSFHDTALALKNY